LHASSLWTLRRLCFGPNVAADYSDRGENRDPGRNKKSLTKEARLENGPPWQALFDVSNDLVGCGHMSGLSARSKRPLALMKSDDWEPYQPSELYAHVVQQVVPGLR